jgi:surface polysaccharide O-acyltransferase-like enzyme
MTQATNRFVGIDLCRGLAAFAVILVHSGDETWGIPISDQAIHFRHLFYFAVPFFIAASFYLLTQKSTLNITLSFWQKKFKRIVVPYFLWSMFYILLKSLMFLSTNNTNQIAELLSDPLGIIFFGAACYHLYFIPLLFVGLLWLYTAKFLMAKKNYRLILLLLAVLGIIARHLIFISDNAFDLEDYTAFDTILNFIPADNLIYPSARIILVYVSWIIRCSPYFFLALFINDIFRHGNNKWLYQKQTIAIEFCIFIFITIQGKYMISPVVSNVILGYSLLFIGISISKYIQVNSIITNLGLSSFGIYLIHPFVKSVLELVLIQLVPHLTESVSITSMLIYSISTFLISWAIISLLLRNKLFAQYI